MRSKIGNYVVGTDFHGREAELGALMRRVRDGNHVLLSGQRRMGKTSIARELGRRLDLEGWTTIFADVEHAASPEDAISELARGTYPVRSITSRIVAGLDRRILENVEELGAADFRIKFRAELNSGNWQRLGYNLISACAKHKQPVLLVIDELPIFLSRLSANPDGTRQVDEFLSWMRHAFQTINNCPVAILAGSIGLLPLVERLGLPDRINYFAPFQLAPWDRETSVACFRHLAEEYELHSKEDVAGAVHDVLGLGVPHFIQRLFAQLRDHSESHAGTSVTKQDVSEAYRTGLLGPWGQGDLIHYETRLRAALDEDSYAIAMEILAETATQGVLPASTRRAFENQLRDRYADGSERVRQILGVLEHDGYLARHTDGHKFKFKLLKDWLKARYRSYHRPFSARGRNADGSSDVQGGTSQKIGFDLSPKTER